MEGSQYLDNSSFSTICPVCKKEIEVFNNDLEFSKELHNQSHKNLSDINEQINGLSIEIHQMKFNDDIKILQKLHSEIHKYTKEIPDSEGVMIPDIIIDSLFIYLQQHIGYITDIETDSARCKVCDLKIEQLANIPNHLESKLHEENILSELKRTLPNKLHHLLEFVSFYQSNLRCNICSWNITLSSKNIYETIFNIIVHSSHDTHLNNISKIKSKETINNTYSPLINVPMLGSHLLPTVTNRSHPATNGLKPNDNFQHGNMSPTPITPSTGGMMNPCPELVNIVKKENCLGRQVMSEELQNVLKTLPKELDFSNIVENEQGQFMCSICNCKIPSSKLNLQTHLTGKKHSKEKKKHEKKKKKCSTKKATTSKSSTDIVPKQSLIKSSQLRANQEETLHKTSKDSLSLSTNGSLSRDLNNTSSNLSSEYEYFKIGQSFCNVCNITITAKYFQAHLSGRKHKNKEKLQSVPSLIEMVSRHFKSHATYISTLRCSVRCDLCNIQFPSCYKTVKGHLRGARHSKAYKKLNLPDTTSK